jgi:hypothetical protein
MVNNNSKPQFGFNDWLVAAPYAFPQECALHLLDLVRAHPKQGAANAARAILAPAILKGQNKRRNHVLSRDR